MGNGKGIRFERELKQLLEKNGYDVIRGAASKGRLFGFDADLVASMRTGQNEKTAYMVVIQCKVKGLDDRTAKSGGR